MDEQVNQEIAQLYVAMFGRAPDAEGLAYWTGLRTAGQSVVQVADAMFGIAPARTYFPDGLSNQDIIASFYENVLGRPADSGGLAFWTAKLNAPAATAGSVISEMIAVIANYAGSDPAGLASAALFNNRCLVAQSYAEHGGTIARGAEVLNGVTQELASVTGALTLRWEDAAGGTVDAAGYSLIVLAAELSADLVLNNVASGCTLRMMNDTAAASSRVVLHHASSLSDAASLNVEIYSHDYNSWFPLLEIYGFRALDLLSSHGISPYGNSLRIISPDLQVVDIDGDASLFFYDYSQVARNLDARDLTGNLWYSPSDVGDGTTWIFGGTGSDQLFGGATDDHMEGGDGSDSIASGAGSDHLTGGPGADRFDWDSYSFEFRNPSRDVFPTILDFTMPSSTEAGDTINMAGFFREYNPFVETQVMLSAGATFDDYLDASCTWYLSGAPDFGLVRWFQYQGDTYLVVDNVGQAFTFQDGVDQIIKLVGLHDLGSDTAWNAYG
jgi:hypothetical protein